MNPKKGDGKLAKLVKLGMGAFWMTEKSVRNAVGELRLPREATQFLIEQIEKRKSEIFDVVRGEIQKAIEKLDVSQLAADFLEDHDVDIAATIRFKRKGR